jgi:hypothetical protein
MAMEGKRITCYYDRQRVEQTNKEFAKTVVHKYRMWCKREGEVFTSSGLALFLLEKNVIRQRTASKYMVLELYPRALYEEENKTRAVLRLEEETGVSERTIWWYLQNQKEL